jgi:hypothetical protein
LTAAAVPKVKDGIKKVVAAIEELESAGDSYSTSVQQYINTTGFMSGGGHFYGLDFSLKSIKHDFEKVSELLETLPKHQVEKAFDDIANCNLTPQEKLDLRLKILDDLKGETA